MLYSLFMFNVGGSGSVWHIRTYESEELTDTTMENVITVIKQAFKATGLVMDKDLSAAKFMKFNPHWGIDGNTKLANGELKTQDARAIAQQLLGDLVSTGGWRKAFNGPDDSFESLDFEKFSYIDETTDNDYLKVPIGKKVYVRGCKDKVYTYQGRPNKHQIKKGDTILFGTGRASAKVWAMDTSVIAVDDFSLEDYTDRMEVFPLPTMGNATKGLGANKYFARTKADEKVKHEVLGKTEEKAQTLLALQLAFG